MIYKKDVNFPYPILTNSSNSYEGCLFDLDIKLSENKDIYNIEVDYTIECYFINSLLENKKAKLYLVIQSIDSKFFELSFGKKEININKNRLSLSKRSQMQLMIKSDEEISFESNRELYGIYKELKEDIVVPRSSVLGFSNVVTFEGSYKKGLELFEKRIDPNIESELKIDLSSESIIITYKKEEFQFNEVLADKSLNNMYIYLGLQKGLSEFIQNNKINDGEEEVIINEIEIPGYGLDLKLYQLMKSKKIEELNKDNIDKVIYLISDGIVERFANSIRGYIDDRG